MNQNLEEQTLALAGLFQSVSLVHQTATRGQCPQEPLDTAIHSLFVTDPERTLDVYGDFYGLRHGLRALALAMGNNPGNNEAQLLRYALSLIQLENKLRRQPEMLNTISERIEQARRGIEHFGVAHPNVIRNLAGIYQDTISTFRIRINVNGHRQFLEIEDNAARIRACLLAGIRSAMLWRQLGGRRWQLIFRRARVVQIAQGLLRDLE